jgi:hypothetical protein
MRRARSTASIRCGSRLDRNAGAADSSNGWGCVSDLFAWVEQTVGAGSNGASLTFTKFTAEGSTAYGANGSPAATSPNASYGGGSYVNCSAKTQPGVPAVLNYLSALNINVNPRCDNGHYYLLNNYNPGYFGDGSNAYTDSNPNNTVFTVPPSSVPTIGDLLSTNNMSWAYYGDQFDEYLGDKYDQSETDEYCNICNWAQ